MFEETEKRPEVFSIANVIMAAVVHVLFFGFCASIAACSFAPKETVIPMDLTLVVHENLDGNDDEPPPQEKPQEQPPPPQPPKVETPPPPPPPANPPDALERVTEKKPEKKPETKPPEKKPEKKPEPKKPEMTREQRMAEMVKRASVVKPKPDATPPKKPVTNGRTGRKTLSDAEIARLLSQGYKPGRTEQLTESDVQRCVSLIYRAFYDKWEAPAYSSSLRDIVLTVQFDLSGRVVKWNIKSGSGDAAADATVKRAAALVKQVPYLSTEFLRENSIVDVRFTVKPQ